jgi:hypothetical protein
MPLSQPQEYKKYSITDVQAQISETRKINWEDYGGLPSHAEREEYYMEKGRELVEGEEKE